MVRGADFPESEPSLVERQGWRTGAPDMSRRDVLGGMIGLGVALFAPSVGTRALFERRHGPTPVLASRADMPLPPRQDIRILIVTDGTGFHVVSFGPQDTSRAHAVEGIDYFGLSEFLRTLSRGTPEFNFVVTKAHRDIDPGFGSPAFLQLSEEDRRLFTPDYQGVGAHTFHFDTVDLDQFDEIWLFGVGVPDDIRHPMTPAELAALTGFMDRGGGVFATGDHENLGMPLCGSVPRVRSMRKWWMKDDPGRPADAPIAPSATGSDRIDTTRGGRSDPPARGSVPMYLFDDQSDDIPQTISPTLFPSIDPVAGITVLQPHPILSYKGGLIDVLPDHMHEGEVIHPWNTGLTGSNDPALAFAGPGFVEYPRGPGGSHQPVPQIIATGLVIPHIVLRTEEHDVSDTVVDGRRTVGLIGAYDGRKTAERVGRVVVDSTFHHFFDINLIGDPLAPSPKNRGFHASAAGEAALEKIKAYYVNVAVWLAREQSVRRRVKDDGRSIPTNPLT
jgi:hypothetical protein